MINGDYLERFKSELLWLGFLPIGIPKDNRVNDIVSSHCDTLIFPKNKLVANKDYIKKLPKNLQSFFIPVTDFPYGNYPTDTVFNALKIGNFIFAHKSVSASVLNYAAEIGATLVPVKQGYARCSTLALEKSNAAITADSGMAASMKKAGIDVLEIEPGHIELSKANYGFIGGASFVCHSKKTVCFFGNLAKHPNAAEITDFILSYGYTPISLNGTLTDIGGAVIISQDSK